MPEFPKPAQLPRMWHPPVSFPMQIWYGYRRPPVQLWTCPGDVDERGRVVLYLAAGPVGLPVMNSLITRIVRPRLPSYARIKVVTDIDRSGQTVFGPLRHNAN